MATTTYALDLPIQQSGGPEHIHQALEGKTIHPANYSFASNDGVKIVYHVCGRGSTLVFGLAPGWGVGINYVLTSLAPLVDSGKFTVIAVQPRGSLPSGRPEDTTRMSHKHMAGDVDALRRLLGYSTINVLGHSSGATMALAYAELFPGHCAKGVLISTHITGFKEGNAIVQEELAKRQDDPKYSEAANAFKAQKGPATSDEMATDFMKAIFPLYFSNPETGVAEFAKLTGPLTVQYWAQNHMYAADASPEADLYESMGQVTAKVLLVSGEDDWICTVRESKVAKDAIGSNARHVVYSKSGHMPWVERADLFYDDVTSFLLE